jgi:glycosyltransferase involved in cell wall biosynthesis
VTKTVSVVVPVYNGEQFVDSCLGSIAAQTYARVETIVVDDGSTDASAARAKNHASKPVVVSLPHGNLPSARNAGIRRASGDYIAFCDVDDLWRPEKLEKQVALLTARPEVGLVFTEVALFGNDPSALKKRRLGRFERAFNNGDQFEILLRKDIIAPSAVLVRRETIDKAGFFDEGLFSCEDWDLWLRIARLKIAMYRINELLTLYRRHGGGMTNKIDVLHRSRLQVLGKAFEGLAETPRMVSLKNRALALAFFEAANGFYSSGDFTRFRECYREARRHGHALLSPKALRRYLRDRIGGKRNTITV